ncbi:MAG TPA: T9SS type A sorting domain-containing protein [candidate division Zixibacteria bacterium]|nr:T9SS type A sorting domain-containing protein [candidate division Zixibacteria bacterium]
MRKFLVVLSLLLVGAAMAQPALPHTVNGYFERFDGTIIPDECLHVRFEFNGHEFDNTSPEFSYFEETGLFLLQITDDLFDPDDIITVYVGDSCLYEDMTHFAAFSGGLETDIGRIKLTPITGLRPVLLGGFIAPETGYVTSEFEFGVTYVSNPWNRAAELVQLWVGDELAWEMDRLGEDPPTWATGEAFRIFVDGAEIGRGDHTYRFYAEDILGLPVWTDPVAFTIMNTPPAITGAHIDIDPEPATVTSALTAVPAGWEDPDGDEPGYIYRWFVNDAEVGEETATLTAPFFGKGDIVYCEVTPFDGIDEGEPVVTEPVAIENTAPGAPVISFVPVPPFDNDNINVIIDEDAFDPDGDELFYSYEWTIDGTIVGDGSGMLDASETAPGDNIRVDVWASDGEAEGPVVSLEFAIEWPVLSDGSVAPVEGAPDETYRYEVIYTSARDIPADAIYAVIDGEEFAMSDMIPIDRVWSEGVLFFYETTLPFGEHTFAFTGFDMEGNEALGEEHVRPGPVQLNELPVITSIEIEPFPTATVADVIVVTAEAEDADGDEVELSYQWFNEDGAIEGATESRLTAEHFAKGDVVWCEVTPFDGWEYGEPITSDLVEIINTPPVVESAIIESDPHDWFNKLAELVAVVVADDIDGDPLDFEFVWFVNDEPIDAEGERLGGENFNRGDLVHFEVTATDDEGAFDAMISEPVEILNSWPIFEVVELHPEAPTTVDELNIHAIVSDADHDEIVLSYEWWLNGHLIDWAEHFVPRHMTRKGQHWQARIIADDGFIVVADETDEVVIGNFIPEVHTIVETIVVWGVPYSNRVHAFDADPLDRLEWRIVEGPENLEIDPATGAIFWTVFDEEETLGVFPTIIEVTDGEDEVTVEFNLRLYPIGHDLFAPRNLDALSGYVHSIPMNWERPNIFGIYPILPLTFTNYEVQRSSEIDDWRTVGSPAGLGFVDATAPPGVTHFYRVRAIYHEGVSAWSNVDFATAGTTNSDMIYSAYTYNASPVLDGEISPGEWADATQLTVGAQKFYVKNTENTLYIAFVDGEDFSLNTGDAFYVQVEDNYNRRWPADLGSWEGEYRVTALEDGLAEATFQGISGTFPGPIARDARITSPAVRGAVGGGDGGAVVYELAIDIGDDLPEQINSAIGNVVGFRFAAYDAGTYSWTQVWTPGSININPESFGGLMLGIGEGGPNFVVWPRMLDVTVLEGETATRPLWLSNQGNGEIDFNIFETFVPFWEFDRSPMNPVLLFTDDANSWLGMGALDFFGFGYDVVNTVEDFVSRLSTEDYLATIITMESGLNLAALGVLEGFIFDGGKAIITCPNLYGLRTHTIWDEIGVDVFATLGAIPSALTWDMPEHQIFHTPLRLPPSVEILAGMFDNYGDGILPVTGASLASFDELPAPGNSAISLAADGAVFINSFAISEDLFGTGAPLGLELLINQIYHLISVEDIPWLSATPESGRLASYATTEGTVLFDATEMPAGDYVGYLVATSTDPGTPMVPVQCVLHVREPDYKLARFAFPPELMMVRPSQVIELPIMASGLHLSRVTEVTMTVRTNEFVISPTNVFSDEYDWEVLSYNLDHITFRVSHPTGWFLDDGVLCNVSFQVRPFAPAGASSFLQITGVSYNEGTFIEATETVNGRVMVESGEADWQVMLRFSRGLLEDNLFIGVHPLGTNMFDDGLDMLDAGGVDWFNAYIDISEFDPDAPRLDGDIRSSADDLIIWQIYPGDSAGKLEWTFRDEDTLSMMGSLYLNGVIDMKTTSVYFYEAGEEMFIVYRAAGDSPFEVTLHPGWNMVALPIILPIEEPTLANVYPGAAFAYYFDTGTNMWVEADRIEPGVGYVVLSTAERHYSLWGRPLDGFNFPLVPGWNLIGSIYRNVDFSSPLTDPAGAVMGLPEHATHWDVNLGEYVFTDVLQSGKGYFVAARIEATLIVPGLGMAKAVAPEIENSTLLRVKSADEDITLKLGTARENWFIPIPPAVDGSSPFASLSFDGWTSSEVYLTKSGSCELVVSGPAMLFVDGDADLAIEIDGRLVPLRGEVHIPVSGAYKVVGSNLPNEFALHPNAPNPFNPATSIAFDLPADSDVRLEVFDLLGRHVRTLENDKLSAGRYSVVWDGRDSGGREVPTGIYLYRIEAGEFRTSRRMLLLK